MLRRSFLLAAVPRPKTRASDLARVYGLALTEVVYIQAVALIGQLRLGHVAQVEKLVQPFIDGTRDSLAKLTPSHLSGHLLFAELAKKTGKPEYQERVQAAAARAQLSVYNEMSDGVFMGPPILARAGRIDEARAQFQALEKLCLRADGLYRHSPLSDAAWGRGNAFPALGLALTLEAMAPDTILLPAFQRLCETLLPFQTENGLWRQVIDRRDAYEEFSATAMIGAAFQKGIRHRWLPKRGYQQAVSRAWAAIAARSTPSGELQGVCESTGKQSSVESYLTRKAIHGRDPRGGAMALYFATELDKEA